MLEICLSSHAEGWGWLSILFFYWFPLVARGFIYSRKSNDAREHSLIPQLCPCYCCFDGMVLGMDTGWDKQHFPKPFPGTVQRDQRSGATFNWKFAYSLRVLETKKGQWHGQKHLVPAGIREQCQTCWIFCCNVATMSTWSRKVIFITVLPCRRETRLENGGLHSDNCHRCLPSALKLQ